MGKSNKSQSHSQFPEQFVKTHDGIGKLVSDSMLSDNLDHFDRERAEQKQRSQKGVRMRFVVQYSIF